MKQTATYNQARSLKHALAKFGVNVLPETFEMTTSGIFIPRWLGYSRIPHHYDPVTGIAEWFFFLRVEGHADMNVGEALDFTNSFQGVHGASRMSHLAERIKSNFRVVKSGR
jgi:hypothetical protein